MKNKGLYGQAQGNEQRQAGACFAERLADNETVEGQHVAVLQARFSEQDWTGFTQYIEDLKKGGFSQPRIQSIMARATCGRI